MSDEDSASLVERIMHYLTIIIAVILIIAAGRAVLIAVTLPSSPVVLDEESKAEQKGKVKPLPDYMIDNIKPDELDQLKQ